MSKWQRLSMSMSHVRLVGRHPWYRTCLEERLLLQLNNQCHCSQSRTRRCIHWCCPSPFTVCARQAGWTQATAYFVAPLFHYADMRSGRLDPHTVGSGGEFFDVQSETRHELAGESGAQMHRIFFVFITTSGHRHTYFRQQNTFIWPQHK